VDMKLFIHIHIHIHRFSVNIHGYIHIHRCPSCIHVGLFTEYPQSEEATVSTSKRYWLSQHRYRYDIWQLLL